MPKNKFQDVVLTAIMATIMVYGMVVYNVALATGGLTAESFLLALYELPIMVPIAFVLEFFAVGKIARRLAFTVMRPTDTTTTPCGTTSSISCVPRCRCARKSA